jgi:two-component system sensor histidine kinase KdpD
MLVRRSFKLSMVRYVVSTGTVAVIVAVYFRWLHVNETTVAMTLMVGNLLVAANWVMRHAIYLSD